MIPIYGFYLDSFLFSNMLMDALALYLTGIFLKHKLRWWRLTLAALLGSILTAILFMTLSDYLVYTVCMHVVVTPIMLLLTYGWSSIRRLVQDWVVCYGFLFVTGGIMQWVNRTLFHGMHLYLSMFLTMTVGVILSLVWEKQKLLRKSMCQVMLKEGSHKIALEGYYDSGNLLMDPYSGEPVSIVNKEFLQKKMKGVLLRTRLIPFHSVGRKEGLLETVTMEELWIKDGIQQIHIAPAVVGLANETLFRDKRYQIILNCRFISEEMKN